MRLKVGRYYQQSDGTVHGPIRHSGGDICQFESDTGTFRADGGYLLHGRCSSDLIRECTASGHPITRRKRAAKKNGRMVVFWCWTRLSKITGYAPLQFTYERSEAVEARALDCCHADIECGPITKVLLPLPAMKGKKCQ